MTSELISKIQWGVNRRFVMTSTLFRRTALAVVLGSGVLVSSLARADEVLDWNAVLQRALFVSNLCSRLRRGPLRLSSVRRLK